MVLGYSGGIRFEFFFSAFQTYHVCLFGRLVNWKTLHGVGNKTNHLDDLDGMDDFVWMFAPKIGVANLILIFLHSMSIAVSSSTHIKN